MLFLFVNKQSRPEKSLNNFREKWKSQNLKTLLMTKDPLDGIPDFVNMPGYSFDRSAVDELHFAFEILILALKPVYSGSVDHRVNTLDLKKTKEVLASALNEEYDYELIN